MALLAHHVAVELLGREFSPHTTLEHVCVFAALAFVAGTSAFGCWTLAKKALESGRARNRA